MGDDLLRLDQPTLHQANGLLHGQRGRTETRIHAGLQKMHEPPIQFKGFVSRDSKDIPTSAAPQQANHETYCLDGPGGLNYQIGPLGKNLCNRFHGRGVIRVDDVRGTQSLSRCQGEITHIHSDQATRPGSLGDHQAIHTDGPGPDDHHIVPHLHFGHLDQPLPGTTQGFCLTSCGKGERGWFMEKRIGTGQDILGKAPGSHIFRAIPSSGVCAIAIMRHPHSTRFTQTTKTTGLDNHRITLLNVAHSRTHCGNDTTGFMPWDERKRNIASLPPNGFEISRTKTTGPYLDQNLTGPRFRYRAFFDLKLIHTPQDGR